MITQIHSQALGLTAALLKKLTNIRNAIAHVQEDIEGTPAHDKKIYFTKGVLNTINSVRSLFLCVQEFMETTPGGWNSDVWNALWSNWKSRLPAETVLPASDSEALKRIRRSLRKATNWTIGLAGTAASPRQLVISGNHLFVGIADAFKTRVRLRDARVRHQLARIMRNELKVRVFSRATGGVTFVAGVMHPDQGCIQQRPAS